MGNSPFCLFLLWRAFKPMVLMIFQCPCGTNATTRSPGGDRPCVRCRSVAAPNSSM